MLLVNFRESPATVKRAVQERGYTAPVLLDESGDVTGRLYGVWGPPTVYLIDRRGQLVGRATGPRGWDSPQARQVHRGPAGREVLSAAARLRPGAARDHAPLRSR